MDFIKENLWMVTLLGLVGVVTLVDVFMFGMHAGVSLTLRRIKKRDEETMKMIDELNALIDKVISVPVPDDGEVKVDEMSNPDGDPTLKNLQIKGEPANA